MICMKRVSILLVCIWVTSFMDAQSDFPVYQDDSKPMEERIEDALHRMTLEEKVAMCHAQSKFSSAGVPRLGIPDNWATDGRKGGGLPLFALFLMKGMPWGVGKEPF